MAAGADIALERYDSAILFLAECVLAKGEIYAPFLDKLVAERDRLATRQDPMALARAIVDRAKQRQVS